MENIALYYVVLRQPLLHHTWIRELKRWHPELYQAYSNLYMSHHERVWILAHQNRTSSEICALLIGGLHLFGDTIIRFLRTDLNGFVYAKILLHPTEDTLFTLAHHGMCSGIQYLMSQHSLIVHDIARIVTLCITNRNSLRIPLICLLQYLVTHPHLYHGGLLFDLTYNNVTVFEYVIRFRPHIAETLLKRFPEQLNLKPEHLIAATESYSSVSASFRRRAYFEVIQEITTALSRHLT